MTFSLSSDRPTIARIAVLPIAAAALLLAACAKPHQPAARPTVDAETVVARRTSMRTFHSAAGTVRAQTSSTLAANVVGTVVRVRVAEGDRVRAGDVLVEIDAREHRANADRTLAGREEVEGAIDAAAANAQLAEATYRRFDALRARGSASQQELDEAKARHTAAQADLARLVARRGEARAAAAQAAAVLGYSTVRAPMSGVVTARYVDPGAQAAPGVPLVAIEDEQATRVDAHVPEDVIVRAGDEAVVEAGAQRLTARVVRVQPTVDASARSALVQLQLAQPLRAGTFVKVGFPAGAREAVMVPVHSLVQRGQLTSVFVVGADRVARMRLITVGATDGASAEVLSGVAVGEAVVVEPSSVRDGALVRSRA
jgi:RND family efflux transporter MFP subunit